MAASFATHAPRWGLLLALLAVPAGADVRLPRLFSDHLVLQRGMALPIWGWAEPGEQVTVTLHDRTVTTTGGDDGKWLVKLDPLEAGGPYELTVAGRNTITVTDVLVGEVWVCSGQSNLIFRIGECSNNRELAAGADLPGVRMLVVDRDVASKTLEDLEGVKWTICSPRTVGGFSAVGYCFGRDAHQALGVPVGLIQSGVTDTRAEFYMSPAALASDPDFAMVYRRWENWKKEHNLDEDFPGVEENLHAVYQDQRPMRQRWQRAVADARARGEDPPAEPKYLPWRIFKNYPSGQWHAMIRPLMPYGIRGVIWYQGEGNTGEPLLYRKLLPALIADWRAHWGQGDFPFLIVQLPLIRPPRPGWEELRQAQLLTRLSVPNTGLAVTWDLPVGEQEDALHPPNKAPMGQRLARIALGDVYGQDVASSGPLYRDVTRQGATLRVRFDFAAGLRSTDGQAIVGFEVAGEDGKFVPGRAVVAGQSVIVSHPDVPEPVRVRYAWACEPVGNLTNASGLPAASFAADAR